MKTSRTMTILYSLFPNHIDHNVDIKAPICPQLPGPSGARTPLFASQMSRCPLLSQSPLITTNIFYMIMIRSCKCGFVARPRQV